MSALDLMDLVAAPLASRTDLPARLRHDALWAVVYGGLQLN